MTLLELKKILSETPDELLSGFAILNRVDQAGIPVYVAYNTEDFYWNGDESESITPKSVLDKLSPEDKEGIDILLWQKGHLFLTDEKPQ